MNRLLRSAVILILALIAGCATTWTRIDDANRSYQGEHYSVVLPTGWMRLIGIPAASSPPMTGPLESPFATTATC